MINTYNYKTNEKYLNFEKVENIEKELYTNVFYGLYESIFCNSDEFIDIECYEKDNLLNKYPFLNENDFEIIYNYENFNNYCFDLHKEYSKLYIQYINDLLPYDITQNQNYLLELKESYMDSPKYYNYRTDKIGLFIKTNYKTLQLIKDYVLQLKDIDQYIYNKNKSYDGFISFLSDNYNYWINKSIEKYECNELSFLFDSLIILEKQKDNLNYELYDNVEKYEYIYPIITYLNKSYDLYDFKNFIENYLKTIKSIYNVVLK